MGKEQRKNIRERGTIVSRNDVPSPRLTRDACRAAPLYFLQQTDNDGHTKTGAIGYFFPIRRLQLGDNIRNAYNGCLCVDVRRRGACCLGVSNDSRAINERK